MNLFSICYAFVGYIAAPQIGVGYNRGKPFFNQLIVIAAPQILYEVYGTNHIQTHAFERGEYLEISTVIRAVWLKEARVVYVCIRIDGVSTDPHNNPP